MIPPSKNGVISSVPPSPFPEISVYLFRQTDTMAQVSVVPLSDMWNGEAELQTPAHICIC